MKAKLCVCVLLAATSACKKSETAKSDPAKMAAKSTEPTPVAPTPAPVPTTPTATAPAPKLPATLTLANAKVELDKGREIKLMENGDVLVQGKVVGTITTDGKLMVNGKLILSMAEDGTVELDPAITDKTVEISRDGTINIDGAPFLKVDDEGKVWEMKRDREPQFITTLDGPPEVRKTFAFVMVASLLGAPSHSQGPTASPVPSGTAPSVPPGPSSAH